MGYPKHIVAAGIFVTNGDDVLLVKTPRRGWEIPGGQIEENENLLAGARREVLEESNVVARINSLAGVYSNLGDPCKVIFDFVGTWISGDLKTSEETIEVEWVPRADVIKRITHPVYRDRILHLLQFRWKYYLQSLYEHRWLSDTGANECLSCCHLT